MRSVTYDHEFDEALKSLRPEFERADEFIRGLEEKLVKNPRFGTQLGSSPVWLVPTIDILPKRFVVYYCFNETHVRLLSLHPADAAPDE